MRLSTSTIVHEKVSKGEKIFYTCEQSIKACVKAGYRVLDMNFCSYAKDDLPMTRPDWEDWVKRQRDLSDSLGIEFSQGHAYYNKTANVTGKAEIWSEELIRRSIIGAGIMGIKWLVIHPYSVDDAIWYSHQKSLAKNVRAFQRYGELAAKNQVGIAIENQMEDKSIRRFSSSAEELLELVDHLNDPLFGICWDFGHAHMAGVNQIDALRTIGKKLKALHVADNKGEKDDHVAPYFGTIVWEPLLKTLKEIGYEGDFAFEIHNFTNRLPDCMQDQILRFTYELGMYMVNLETKD
jgi:L-ribulose-5-phosphate 3-epimerase